MKVELFPFQKKALADIRMKAAEAFGSYNRTHAPQVVSFTAPTGAGKTIIIAALIENILFGDECYVEQQNAIIVWLSDSPQLNEQSKLKLDTKAEKIRLGQCVTITEDSFDKEYLEEGQVYFLNTQKLSKTSNLTKDGDGRTYTIWQTLANTVRDKKEKLYFIIDEAHRGMQGREAGKATTIMQKFIKGSDEDKIPPMPVVIGMSATTERFNKLVEETASTIHKSVVSADEVRSSGLLKDKIVITYPETDAVNNDMAILQAAADNWKEKWEHWTQYCREQHYAYVNPILVVQVLNGTGSKISDTDLDDCLAKIEERVGVKFSVGQVVHTFGQNNTSININGLEVRYEEPSRISDDKNVRVVFFKENLSTGWDCPRAETMMSFRHGRDYTYIAQLLGRMVRTPMQMRIQVDDVLNDVHLYLPYFDENTVKDVIEALRSAEGGDIPIDIYGESISGKKFETLTVKPRKKHEIDIPGQIPLIEVPTSDVIAFDNKDVLQKTTITSGLDKKNIEFEPAIGGSAENKEKTENILQDVEQSHYDESQGTNFSEKEKGAIAGDLFDRENVMQFINDAGLLTYDVRSLCINNYLISLFKMGHLLTMSGLYKEAIKDIQAEILDQIYSYVQNLKTEGKYNCLVLKVKQFKLATQIFDTFGESLDDNAVHDLYTTTDTDIERQFRIAESKLCNEGIGVAYGQKYIDWNNPNDFKVDVILFIADEDNIKKLYDYAKDRFHGFNDEYRRFIVNKTEKIRRQYDEIASNGDIISKHNFRLPETIQVPHDDGGIEYSNHLFVNDITGTAALKLNNWEAGVLKEEEDQADFVCWIRNPARGAWALCIPYELDSIVKPTFPDFIVIRKDKISKYVIDILEPHRPDLKDNLGKAKGFAEYARQNPGVGRIQLIRMSRDITGANKFKRLDLSMSFVRDKVSKIMTNDELDHIFDTDGFFM